MSEDTKVEIGIKETKEMLKFAITFGESIDKSLEDKKIGLEDAMNFYNAVLTAGDAFEGAGKIAAELSDLSQAERDELVAYVEAEFDIANDRTEAVIEEGLKTAMQIYKMVAVLKAK